MDMPKDKTPFGQAVKDTASLEILKPVLTRLRNRVDEIKKMSSAETTTIYQGNLPMHKTATPKMFISGLDASLINGVGTITYSTYKTDSKGNKVARVIKAKSPINDREIEVDASYVLDKTIVETIEFRKPISRREFSADDYEGM